MPIGKNEVDLFIDLYYTFLKATGRQILSYGEK